MQAPIACAASREAPGEFDEGGQLVAGSAGVDGAGGEANALLEIWREVGGDEGGGGVEQRYVAQGAGVAVQDGAQGGGVLLRATTSDGIVRRLGQTDLLRLNIILAEDAVA